MIHVDAAFREEFFEVPYDNPNRKYQRTANRITSGGNLYPTNADKS